MAPRRPSLTAAVAKTLRSVPNESQDAGLRALASIYARAIDDLDPAELGKLLGQLGPGLLRVLEALQSTPHARASVAGRKDVAPPAPAPAEKPPEAIALADMRAKRAGARR